MKEIKVQFDFKITKKQHSFYDSYFDYPPKNVLYTKSKFKGINEKTYSPLRSIYKLLKIVLNKLSPNFERRIKDFLRKEKNVDLIHFANHLGKTDKPFVADYEVGVSLTRGDFYNKGAQKEAKRLLSQKNLKCLLPIHKEALKSFKLCFGEMGLNPKQKVLYPVAFIPEKYRKKVKKEDMVVFGGSSNIKNEHSFYRKGGYETLIAFEKLADKFPKTKFVFLGNAISSIDIPKKKNLIVKEVIPLNELYDLLNRSKVFIQPCYSTPAMMFLIAMFFKLPIITYDYWANKEYVTSKTGILVKPQKIDILNKFNFLRTDSDVAEKIKANAPKNAVKIAKAIEELLKNDKKRKEMGKIGFKKVTKGKFSIKERNKKLRKIYEEALKK